LHRAKHFGKSFDADTLTLFGLFAVTAMLITYAFEQRSPWFILALCRVVRARLGLWLSAGRVAVRACRRRVDTRRASPLAASSLKTRLCRRNVSRETFLDFF
jgi:hypothetical protein